MRLRRAAIPAAAGLAVLAGIAAGALRSADLSARISARVARQLRTVYGLELAAGEPGQVTLLPTPAIRFGKTLISDRRGDVLLESDAVTLEFRVVPLAMGALDVAGVRLSAARITVDLDGEPTAAGFWRAAAHKLRGRLDGALIEEAHLQKVMLTGSTLTLRNRATGSSEAVSNVAALVSWPTPDSDLALSGAGTWRGEAVDLKLARVRPGDLAAGRTSPFDLEVNWRGGRGRASGEAAFGAEPKAAGRASFEARSLPDFLEWTGAGVALGRLAGAVSLDGEFKADGPGLSWPRIRLALGSDHFEGAASTRLAGSRVSVTATLATDSLALAGYLGPAGEALAADGSWNRDPIDLTRFTEGELDLRLSAATASLGRLRFEDVSTNVLVSPGRIEASVGRAGLNRGRLKARLTLAAAGDGVDAKVLGNYEHVDLGALLMDLGHTRWISGVAQGQVALEAVGSSIAALAEHTNGRATMAVRSGDITGLSLHDVLRRGERDARPADIRGGRTPFEEAQVALHFVQGWGEFAEGALVAPTLKGGLQGRVSIPDRTLAAVARVEGVAPSAAGPQLVAFEISGPWDKIAVAPGSRPPSPQTAEPGSPTTAFGAAAADAAPP